MSEKKNKNIPTLTAVTTTYTAPDKDIIQEIYELKSKFLMEFGKEPVGLIISAQDYMCLIERVKVFSRYSPIEYQLKYPYEFMGLPLRLKRRGPLELEVDISDWARYAMGKVK